MTDAPTPAYTDHRDDAHAAAGQATYSLALAMAYRNDSALVSARAHLTKALAHVDAALAASDASDQARRVA